MKRVLQMAVAAGLLATMMVPAKALVIGSAEEANSIPFGSTLGGYIYQQVYNSSNFSGSLTINDISFYSTIITGGTPRTGNFDIYLSTTSSPVGGLPTDVPAGYPAALTHVFSGALPSVSDGRLDFDLTTSFSYDPSLGNLLLTVVSFDVGSGSLYLDADATPGTLFSRRLYAGGGNAAYGLVTGFNDLAATPLPAALPLFASGAGVLGFGVWRRQRKLMCSRQVI